jgi:hypothetical protein
MTNSEYQSFRREFHCSAVCDEGYSAPFDVESTSGAETWLVYIKGSEFRAAHAWLASHRAAGFAR